MNAATVTERKAAHAANVLDAALRLASEGHRVFPVVRNGKAPAIDGGHNSATTEDETIRGWFGPGGEFEGFNLGMRGGTQRRNEATGEAEHLAIIDLDIKNGKNGVQYLTEACKAKGLRLDHFERTRIQRTPGGGLHLLYWAPQPIKQGADVLGERCGVDTRDAGGFIVVALSFAPSGWLHLVRHLLDFKPQRYRKLALQGGHQSARRLEGVPAAKRTQYAG